MARLGAASLVDSIRGKYGGYRLSKKPSEYTIIEILMATEESMAIISSLDEGVSTDDVINERTVGFWAGLQNYIHDYLESVTLQDVIDGTYAKLDTKYDNWDGSI